MFTSLYFITPITHGGYAFQYFAQSNCIFVKCDDTVSFKPCRNKSELADALTKVHGASGMSLAMNSILQDLFCRFPAIESYCMTGVSQLDAYDTIFPDFPL